MTVREPLASLGRESAARAEKTVRKRPHRPPGPSDAAPERAAAVPGEASRRCQAQQGKMFNVESVERVELCESLLTWVCAGRRVAGSPFPQAAFPGSPTPSAGGERRGPRCRHIRGLVRA